MIIPVFISFSGVLGSLWQFHEVNEATEQVNDLTRMVIKATREVNNTTRKVDAATRAVDGGKSQVNAPTDYAGMSTIKVDDLTKPF